MYKYAPILSISPAEMNALEELPDKDKDLILPIIPLKGWVGSKKLENSISRIMKAIGDRLWVADIDSSFIEDNKKNPVTGKYEREVFYEIQALLDPTDGYENWYQYIKAVPAAIPTIQLNDIENLATQINKLNSLGRGLVVQFKIGDINSGHFRTVLKVLVEMDIHNVFIVFDYGEVQREVLSFAAGIISIIQSSHELLPAALIAISCSSFPSSFSGSRNGEFSIYERLLFNEVSGACPEIRMIYSDRGSARVEKNSGGGGIPIPPRIDYPLANDWRFIREEFDDPRNPEDNEKEELYTEIAKKIMRTAYWNRDLHVWGTQVIELTSKAEKLGISSPAKATAVRINIHMHQQLYYDAPIDLVDTDEDWED